jgi:hypothetical protein
MKMIRLAGAVLLLTVVLASGPANALPRETMNGKTQIEREIRWAWKYLKELTVSCLASKVECKDPEIRAIVTELDSYLLAYDRADSASWAALLSFIAEKDHPGVFTTAEGDVHRIAVTQLTKFTEVKINTDRMQLPLGKWVGILAHESVHHLGYKDDERRLPDRVGVELATHFQRRALEGTLESFNRPDAHSITFNSEGMRGTVGFFSTSTMTFDLEWGNTSLVKMCAPDEAIVKQFVGNPVWSINRLRVKTGIVTLRGGGFVNVLCQKPGSNAEPTVKRWLLAASLDLQYTAPLKIESWAEETPEVLLKTGEFGPSTFKWDAIWGMNQTFRVKTVEHNKAKIGVGEKWTTKVTVKSMDGLVPKRCEVYMSGANWSFQKELALPATNLFSDCTITSLGNDLYVFQASYIFPAGTQTDDFYIPLLRVFDPSGDRFAVPRMTRFVHYVNPTAGARAEITATKVTGLPQIAVFDGRSLRNSYQAKAGQRFQVELTIKGNQELSGLEVELPMWAKHPQGMMAIFFNGPLNDAPWLCERIDIIRTNGGARVVLNLKMPAEISGFQIEALRFARIYMRTSDFSWVEIENLDENSGLIVQAH